MLAIAKTITSQRSITCRLGRLAGGHTPSTNAVDLIQTSKDTNGAATMVRRAICFAILDIQIAEDMRVCLYKTGVHLQLLVAGGAQGSTPFLAARALSCR